MGSAPTRVGLTAVIVAVTDEVPRVLLVRSTPATVSQRADCQSHGIAPPIEPDALPSGPFVPAEHSSLDRGVRGWVSARTGLNVRYVEQLYTFGNRFRDSAELRGGPRLLTVAYLALAHEHAFVPSDQAIWRDWYGFLPWEDWRDGRPSLIEEVIRPALTTWIATAHEPAEQDAREERVGLCFGGTGAIRDPVLALERYELLYEAGLVAEALRDRAEHERAADQIPSSPTDQMLATASRLGGALIRDDRRILAAALARLRGKLAYRPVVFDLLPAEFTLFHLQRVVEALVGTHLHKQNFRRMLMQAGIVEATGQTQMTGRGRPAELYRFRRDVTRARAVVGIGLPATRAAE